MLPIGSIFFPLGVAPMKIENFKGHSIEKLSNYANMSVLKSPNFDTANIK